MGDLIDETVNRLVRHGFDASNAPLTHKVAVMVTTAQGLIDNGGFEYLLGNPFSQQVHLGDFVLVYETIGAVESARAVAGALAQWRRGGKDYEPFNTVLWAASDANYNKLAAYIECHRETYV